MSVLVEEEEYLEPILRVKKINGMLQWEAAVESCIEAVLGRVLLSIEPGF